MGTPCAQPERWIPASCISLRRPTRRSASRRMAPTSRGWRLRWESTDDVGAALALGMEPFDRVCGVQLLAVLPGEAHVGEDVVLGFVHENGQLGHLGPELVGDLAPLGLRAGGVLPGRRRWRRRRRRRATASACRHGPAGCGRSARGSAAMWRLRIRVTAAFRPLWSSPITSWTPRRPVDGPASAGTRSSRASASDAPIATPRTSRRPWSLTATATVTATETMRPVWRTFT